MVDVASKLFQAARVQYIEVHVAQRHRVDATMVLIDTKKEQLSTIANTYQALGGGLVRSEFPAGMLARPIESAGEEPVIPPLPEQK